MKYPIALFTLVFSLNASAGCPLVAPSTIPTVPNGASASADAMESSMVEVKAYVRSIEDFVSCRGAMLNTGHYDELIGKAEAAAAAFNTQLQVYRESTGALAKN